MNHKLKLCLLEHGTPQYEIAQQTGMSESRLSRIVRGRVEATSDERSALARALGISVKDLFGANGRRAGGGDP